ncbi:enoyl-CoA hydratase/isomerase family protein [Amycolatopsis thermoflava]|uniref:enoyl-CoA hydratase/isomerase family protein n=1 Tax=Amycolatopsis thermoflava TaxID=84480 RepID=UPI00381E2F3B
MGEHIRVSGEGPVRTLTIDRPARRNALAASTADELAAEVRRAESDRNVGALVLTGAGGHFCAGGDADSALAAIADESDDAPERLMRAYHRAVEAIWTSPLPVIAAVSGFAYGAGFNLMLACDLVVCSADSRFCQVFLRRGVVPDFGGAYLLPRLVGMQRAKELILLAPEIDAEHAHRLGLVNEIVAEGADLPGRARELGEALAAGSRFTVAQTKKLLNASTAGTLPASLELEAITQAAVLRSSSAKRGFEAFLGR